MTDMIVTDEARRLAAIRALRAQDIGGGEKLIDFADTVLVGVAEIDLDEPYPEDRCHEIADGAVPVYHHEVIETAAEDTGLMMREPELGPASGDAYDGTATPINLAAANLYELASNIASEALRARQEEAEGEED